VRFGWAQSEPSLPKWPAAASANFTTTAADGWTHGLENDESYNGFLDSYLLPSRGEQVQNGGTASSLYQQVGFETKVPTSGTTSTTGGEKYFYAFEIAIPPISDTTNPQVGPRMSPIVDDISIFYLPHSQSSVIWEGSVTYD